MEAFAAALREKLREPEFARRYLHTLVDEVLIDNHTATLKGSTAKLAAALEKEKEGNLNQVPSFMCCWRPHG